MIEVTLRPAELLVGEDADLVVQLANTGPGTCMHIIFRLTLPDEIMLLRGQDKIRVNCLEPGETETHTLCVRALSAARCRATSPNFSYRDHYGETHRVTDFCAELVTTVPERRGPAAEAQPPARKVDLVTDELPHGVQVTKESQPSPSTDKEPVVLFFAANPIDAEPLRTGKEFMVIVKALENGQGAAKVKIRPWLAARAKDISRELLQAKPWIVHFAGHGGGPSESFIAENEDGYAYVIPPGGLVKLFETAGENVECVIINACSTVGLAQALSQHVDYVIAMSQPINDWAAIEFSRAFYQALAANYSIRSAFNLGVAELEMLSDGAAYEIPQLLGLPA